MFSLMREGGEGGCMLPVLQPLPAMSPTGPISLCEGRPVGVAPRSTVGCTHSHTVALPNAC